MKTHSWVQIVIRIDERYQDLLVGLLVLLGFTGFVQEEITLQCIIPKQQWTKSLKQKFESALAQFKIEFPFLDLSTSWTVLHEENWNKKWEQQTGIVEATPTIVIKPSWKNLPKRHAKKTVLHIDPKMSFGTGHHETTRLCLQLIQRFLAPRMNVLDFGTGTGVLGIACIKLGAQSVFAIDNDEWALENALENVKRNAVQRRMTVRIGSISSVPRRKYDLIVANIDYRTISRFIASLNSRVKKKGVIILSGILTKDLPELIRLFSTNGLVPLARTNENEWTCIALGRVR